MHLCNRRSQAAIPATAVFSALKGGEIFLFGQRLPLLLQFRPEKAGNAYPASTADNL